MASTPGVQRAVDIMGSHAKLGDPLGISRQAVAQWALQGYVPWERVAEVHTLTGVPKRDLIDPRLRDLLEA